LSSRRVLALCLALCALAARADAKVFYSREEAIALAFPDADRVESQSLLLDDAQAARVEELSRAELETRLVRLYTGYRGQELLGYAFIDVHNVRTLPEAFLIVLDPAGEVSRLRLLAFHEPPEYMPSEKWYAQFHDKTLDASLRVGDDVHGIVGATLSSRATTQGVRRALALYQVVVHDGNRNGNGGPD
jgi:hypothetical protein